MALSYACCSGSDVRQHCELHTIQLPLTQCQKLYRRQKSKYSSTLLELPHQLQGMGAGVHEK
jgi:hypothetical protein